MKLDKRNRASGGRLEDVSGALLVRRFSVRQPEIYRVIERVSTQKLTLLSQEALCELAQAVMDLEYDGIDGDILQAGCGLGGEAIVIAHAKRRNRPLMIHDPFNAGPDAKTRLHHELTAHNADERFQVQILPGPYQETLAKQGALALACLDTREYNSLLFLLESLAPRLMPSGQLIITGHKNREGCQKAVEEYFLGKTGFRFVRKSRLHVVKG